MRVLKHENNDEDKVEVLEGIYTFDTIYKKPYIPENLIEEIKKSNVLLIPRENFRGKKGTFFPEETYSLFTYLRENFKDKGINIEICTSDDDYQELELHSELVNIAEIIVESGLFSIVTSMIASYLYDILKKHNRKDIGTSVNITVEEKGKSKTVHYEGSIENFESAMKSVEEHIFK